MDGDQPAHFGPLAALAVKDYPDFLRKLARRIGLADKFDIGVEPAVVNDRIARITGGE